MMPMNKKNKKITLFSVLIKRIKIRHLLFVLVLLVANTYAWFIYVNTVSNSVDVHVKGWRIDFTDGITPITEYTEFIVENVYPGMTPYSKPIETHNYSELNADVNFVVLSANIMGDEYITEDGKLDQGLQLDGDEMTSDELITLLGTEYPFIISFSMTSNTLAPTSVSTYTISINWPYESGDDELDTYWGTRAYSYRETYPDDPCITLQVKIVVSQSEDQGTNNGEGTGD